MSTAIAILDTLPPMDAFYSEYWNQRPFLVRNAIEQTVLDRLITPDELAALSMEETARARIVTKQNWDCRFGPFTEQDFKTDDKSPWSLLVQNVEQFHPDTSALLSAFNFAPRWLMDDIMVSFSTAGGTIGGHVDSYHVFLVQGSGTRRWTISDEPVINKDYIDSLDLKILKDPVNGKTVEVTTADIIYIPPHFAHEGITLEDALTFSVGFLGPKLSELYGAYSQYLADHDVEDLRYVGEGLTADSAGFTLADDTVAALEDHLEKPLGTPGFAKWLAAFFTGSTNEEIDIYSERNDPFDAASFAASLQEGVGLIKPAYVKFALTPSSTASNNNRYSLGFDREIFDIDEAALPVILSLMKEKPITAKETPALLDHLDLLRKLYNHQALEFIDAES